MHELSYVGSMALILRFRLYAITVIPFHLSTPHWSLLLDITLSEVGFEYAGLQSGTALLLQKPTVQ